jgi:hypothetical protein
LAGQTIAYIFNMLHIIKLAVGVRDVAHLGEIQKARAKSDPPLRHRTRNSPRRADEIISGGSIYWVINRVVMVRQRITGIIRDHWEDGSDCAGLLLDRELIRVAARPTKAFQGWRYLSDADAPADLGGSQVNGIDALPEPMRLALSQLALL